jgi:integration host factor subunit beta
MGTAKTVTKKDLVDRITKQTGLKRTDVRATVQEFLEAVIKELAAGNRIEFRDFGVFEIKERAPRVAQNPKTLERVEVPAKRTVKFKAGRSMREKLEEAAEAPAPLKITTRPVAAAAAASNGVLAHR